MTRVFLRDNKLTSAIRRVTTRDHFTNNTSNSCHPPLLLAHLLQPQLAQQPNIPSLKPGACHVRHPPRTPTSPRRIQIRVIQFGQRGQGSPNSLACYWYRSPIPGHAHLRHPRIIHRRQEMDIRRWRRMVRKGDIPISTT